VFAIVQRKQELEWADGFYNARQDGSAQPLGHAKRTRDDHCGLSFSKRAQHQIGHWQPFLNNGMRAD
jgi:hypothetical protein